MSEKELPGDALVASAIDTYNKFKKIAHERGRSELEENIKTKCKCPRFDRHFSCSNCLVNMYPESFNCYIKNSNRTMINEQVRYLYGSKLIDHVREENYHKALELYMKKYGNDELMKLLL